MEQTFDDSLENEPNIEETYENPLTYHEPNDQQEEEEEDTLSLSDLPIYRDAADEGDLATGELPSPRTLSESDHFEFSSGQIFAASLPTLDPPPQDPIIFCGKIIPYKKEEEEPIRVYEDTSNVKKPRLRRRRWRIFRWKRAIYLFSKSSSSSSSTNSSSKGSVNSGKSGSTKLGLKDDGNKRRISILATETGTKSRWYMIMFGFGSARFHQSSEMKIRDLRKRQSFFMGSMGSRSGGSGGDDDDDRKSSGGSCGCGRGMGLIRFLGCGGDEVDHHANAIVKL